MKFRSKLRLTKHLQASNIFEHYFELKLFVFFGFQIRYNLDGTEMGELLQEIGRLSLKNNVEYFKLSILEIYSHVGGVRFCLGLRVVSVKTIKLNFDLVCCSDFPTPRSAEYDRPLRTFS